jgi:hypothetical protein
LCSFRHLGQRCTYFLKIPQMQGIRIKNNQPIRRYIIARAAIVTKHSWSSSRIEWPLCSQYGHLIFLSLYNELFMGGFTYYPILKRNKLLCCLSSSSMTIPASPTIIMTSCPVIWLSGSATAPVSYLRTSSLTLLSTCFFI